MRRPSRCTIFMLTPEFHADVTFWRLLVGGALQYKRGALHPPLYSFFLHPPRELFGPTRPVTQWGGIA